MEQVKLIKPFLTFDSLEERRRTDFIVVHHTAIAADSSAKDIHQIHLNQGYSGIGYHFLIRKNGAIEKGRPVWAVGAHAYGYNAQSIGVCLSGNFEVEKPTDFQIESAALLIANLCYDFNLPISRRFILGHRELNATACPGDKLFFYLDTVVGKANWYFSH